MSTCSSTINSGTVLIGDNLSDDLSEYGLMRDKANKKAGRSDGEPNFFGLKCTGDGYRTAFGDPYGLSQKHGFTLAVVAPEYESFDMLVTKDLPEAVRRADPSTVRAYVGRILDEV